MRIFISMTILLASVSALAASDYTESRDLNLDAGDLGKLVINAGAGSLDVKGVAGQGNIEVRATIIIPDSNEDKGRKIVTKHLTLELVRDGRVAKLDSWFDKRFWSFGPSGRIDLEVTAPESMVLEIDDGSGSIDVANFTASVKIDDGSGSIDVHTVGELDIDDGSGSIDVSKATGDVYINDGSGSITVEGVGGTVTIDDGSGSIRVSDVSEDLVIIDAGSGGVSFSGIAGAVEQEG